ncbi:uncharacterized protein LOC101240192 [Hydra vulgaris]|uniref:uncharacterized protein LOC101240192 n=1 Tax=Hydra vulgaris TaxID=6087 RepID=UPI001F5FD8EC|nr:uncharacterized protein LOC101240192 [Hydra vulgaris]
MCMESVKVSKYSTSLEVLLQNKNLLDKPECMWNIDDTGMQLEHKPRHVVAREGSKYIQSRTSGNKETITVICCINAVGQVIPPHIIGKGKIVRTFYGFDTENAPSGATWNVSEKGWTKRGIAELWFEKKFLQILAQQKPQILILDVHDSHNFVEMIELAIVNQIEIVELPALSSNCFQPCDRTVFKPL